MIRDGNAIAAEEGIDNSFEEAVLLSVLKRGKQPNLSYFAFTATPKYKTLKVFDEPGPDGQAPFHLYSMRQAIEEGFIHDVLKHYVIYKTYFKLAQAAGEDREVQRREAAKSLGRYMQHHLHKRSWKAGSSTAWKATIEVFCKVMGDEDLRRMASDYLLRRIYDRVRQSPQAD